MVDVFAHRGLHQLERENTVAAFRAAVELGVDGVELDVRRTLDGALVVHHDATAGELVIADSEARTLPSYVPTLEEALTSLAGVRVNVEIKTVPTPGGADVGESGGLARQVVSQIRALGWRERVSISCFDLAICAAVRSLDRELEVAWLLWDVDLDGALTRAHVLGLDAINPHYSTVDADVVRRAREFDLDVNVWTVNDEHDLSTMIALDVNCVITDDPATAMAVVARARSSPSEHRLD